MKTCKTCGETKRFNEYYHHTANDNYYAHCKVCMKAAYKNRYLLAKQTPKDNKEPHEYDISELTCQKTKEKREVLDIIRETQLLVPWL